MEKVYIAKALRTPIGSFGGTLSQQSAAQLGTCVLNELLKQTALPASAIDEVLVGSALQAGQGQNVARQIALNAGLDWQVPATTINMVCGSGMRAILNGIQSIMVGDNQIVIAGGSESMSNAPYLQKNVRFGAKMGQVSLEDSLLYDGLEDAFSHQHMGLTAETLADQYNLTRAKLDEYAYQSQLKTKQAQESGRFVDEIVPVEIQSKKGSFWFTEDEHPRTPDLSKLAQLRPAFKKDGLVTAGNASGINDGAALVLLTTKKAAATYNLELLAEVTGWGQAGVNPEVMGLGPVPAVKKALKKADLTLDEIDLIELNEAFAAQALADIYELGLDQQKVNVNGGAIALGHPIGASGARILVSLVHELTKRPTAQNGLATLCIGGGMGIAMTIKKV